MIKKPILKKFDEIIDEKGNIVDQSIINPSFLSSNNYFLYDFKRTQEIEEIYGGTMPKFFALCKSECLKEMFEDILDPESSYVTYLNDVIKNEYVSGSDNFPVKEVSVMIKRNHSNCCRYSEELGSIIGNIFKVPVVYNRCFKENIDGHECYEYFILSVDFMKTDVKFATIYDTSIYKLKNFKTALDFVMNEFENTFSNDQITYEQRERLARELIPIFFFQRHVIQNPDFNDANIGYFYNTKTKEFSWAPAFDFEYAFSNESDIAYAAYRNKEPLVLPTLNYSKIELKQDIATLILNFPKEAKELVSQYSKILENDMITKELSKYYTFPSWYSADVNSNLKKIIKTYKKLEKEKNLKHIIKKCEEEFVFLKK